MTTVGYGDYAPKSLMGRTFCMIWILLGITVMSTFTGLVTSAISSVYEDKFSMRGSVIGALHGSEEFKVSKIFNNKGDTIAPCPGEAKRFRSIHLNNQLKKLFK